MNKSKIYIKIILLILFLTIALFFKVDFYSNFSNEISILSLLFILYFLIKPVLAELHHDSNKNLYKPEISVIVTFYNEKSEYLVKCIDSILDQSYPPKIVYIVDDGSAELTAYEAIKNKYNDLSIINLSRSKKNQGKRHAQVSVLAHINTDIIVTVDSDTFLDKNAFIEGIKAFEDQSVYAVSGNIRAYNKEDSFISKIIDLRYKNAFEVERAAYSFFGSVLCATGMFSLYRREVLTENINRYTSEKMFNHNVLIGADRALSVYALEKGKVLIQKSAFAETIVPSKLKGFLKQQFRWNRSFFREAIKMFFTFKLNKAYWYLYLFELLSWLMLPALIVSALFLETEFSIRLLGSFYVGYFVFSTYGKNLNYIFEDIVLYIFSPIIAFLHLLVLVPVRIYCILTIKNNSWNTR